MRATTQTKEKEKVLIDDRGMLDLPFLILTLLLVTIGVIMMFSASYARAYADEGNSAFYFWKQLRFALIGIAGMYAASRFNYQLWRPFSLFLAAGCFVLLLLTPIIGFKEGGATRWIAVPGLGSFQPSEVAKLAVVLLFANMISNFREKMNSFRYGVLPFAGVLAVTAGLLALEPHLSATLIIGATGAVMMFLGGTPKKWFLIGFGVALVGAALYLAIFPYAAARLESWRDPFSDPSDSGLQLIQSLYAIGSGGLMGLGFGKSRQKYLYLPEEHNDYIFAIVCEELGFIGAVVIILLFVLLIVRGFLIAQRARDRFGTLVAAGLSTLLALQVFFNIGVVTNFLPSTGISLPFFSYGGTALMMQLGEMGIILNISRNTKRNLQQVREATP